MARSRRKTVPQQVVDVATTGLPAPAKKILGNRLVALLIVTVFPVLLALGVVSVNWQNGRPSFSVNRQRAAEVGKTAREDIQELRQEIDGKPVTSHGLKSSLELDPTPGHDFSLGLNKDTSLESRVVEQAEQFRDDFRQDDQSDLHSNPHSAGRSETPHQAIRPFSKLKERLDEIR